MLTETQFQTRKYQHTSSPFQMTAKVITQDRPIPTASPGLADIVGFGVDGVVILRNGSDIQSFMAVKDFGYNAGGWRVDKHVRLVADVTGDRNADIVGFGDEGVSVSFNNGDNSFQPIKLVLDEFSYNVGGWRVDKHIRYLADIRGVGRCDIVGFGNGGVVVSRNDGDAKFNPVYTAIEEFGYDNGGWRLDRHLRFLGDVTGDGLPDIIGFGEDYISVARNNGDGTFAPSQPVIHDFCCSPKAGGWRIDQHPRCIADLTGDGKVDVIGFGSAGVYVSLNQGNGTFGPVNLVIRNFATAFGWKVDKNPRYVADLTGDKRGDVIGFGDAGVYVSYNNGDGTFQPAKLVINDFGVQQGWLVGKHPRYVVDLTGDGCADIIGFGESNVYVAYNDGKGGFGPVTVLLRTFAYKNGWSEDKTVRWLANLDQSR